MYYNTSVDSSWVWSSSSQCGSHRQEWGLWHDGQEEWWGTSDEGAQWQQSTSTTPWYGPADSGLGTYPCIVPPVHSTHFAAYPHWYSPPRLTAQWNDYIDTSSGPSPAQAEQHNFSTLAPAWQQRVAPPSSPQPTEQSRSNSIASVVQSDIAKFAPEPEDDPMVDVEIVVSKTFIHLRERRPSLNRCSSFPELQA
mmetsp:Transcript_18024/g.42126  ORF Transcript_18024/g.42126 Transcript_18024/m.42126 type:complete len:195 (+) Transcript_18024:79-663(+)|eukprot:CAMPEP_0178453394 /NCGR_PEP_ID=MMETSP0689_2-20121128/44787_1 /TAXON_ID=160604 /ORGANISM="Amphidinium massartii, Strain CS-259" /LENGTH=194 /DNA_ID=CAMNT_0020079229 /DNA_START=1 /DNA_END=585 /DNA_ORIENTATION=+